MHNNTTPYAFLSEEQKSILDKAGELLVYNFAKECWDPNPVRKVGGLVYRLPELTPPFIPWHRVEEKWKFFAKDGVKGGGFFFVDRPYWDLGGWECTGSSEGPASCWPMLIDHGTCEPKDSLVERPK